MEEERIKIVSVSTQRLSNLRCIIGRIDSKEVRDSSVKSWYHWRILKCRLLIHSIPAIMASPITNNSNRGDIYILLKTDLLSTGKIQKKLNEMSIKHSEPLEVTQRVYEACLSYTISFKVAPQWNKVGEYFVKGKQFLASLSLPTDAIKMGIVVKGEETHLSISPASVKLPALSLRDFSLPERNLETFSSSDNRSLDLNGSDSRLWVRVLPSLKKGKVISVSKQIPDSCAFANYQQLKRHWKNMYGYRLPETDVGLIYYQIYFAGLGQCTYTYPSCCVSSAELEDIKIDNTENNGAEFLKYLAERMPGICGASLKLEQKARRRTSDDLDKEADKENVPNFGSLVAAKYTGKTWNKEQTPNLTLSGNYILPGSDNFPTPLSMISDNTRSIRLRHDVIKDKNLRDALNMKPFLDFQSAGRKGASSCSNVFLPVVGNKRFGESANIFGATKEKSQKLQKLTKTNPDESFAADQTDEHNESLFSLLRSRSSFDLNDFDSALGENCSFNGDLSSKLEEKGVQNEVEIKSHYFDHPASVSQDNDNVNFEKQTGETMSSSSLRVNLRRLSNRKSVAPKSSTLSNSKRKDQFVHFKTKDISSYFKEQKKQVGVCNPPKTGTKTSVPRLNQTQLKLKKDGILELLIETGKKETRRNTEI